MVYAMQAIGLYKESEQASALKMRDYKDSTDLVLRGGVLNEPASRNQIVRLLWSTYGAQEIFEWCSSILETLQSAEVLQQGLYETSIQSKAECRNKLDDCSLPCPKLVAEWLLRDMREQQERGCSSYRWESAKQYIEQSTKSMPKLPCENPSSCKEMFNMWRKGEGIWLLQQALYQIQEIRRSVHGEWKGGDGMKDVSTAVRRLTPL